MLRDHPITEWNALVTVERDRFGDHVTTVFPTEYARVNCSSLALTRRGMEQGGHVVTDPISFRNGMESSGHRAEGR